MVVKKVLRTFLQSFTFAFMEENDQFQFAELNKKVSYTHPYLSRIESISKNKNLVQNDSPAVKFSRQVFLMSIRFS